LINFIVGLIVSGEDFILSGYNFDLSN